MLRHTHRAVTLLLFMLLALPLSHSPVAASTDTMTMAERVARLEEFRQQQRDWNQEMDGRLSTDLTASQGAQDVRMAAIEERLNLIAARQMVVYAFGGLGSLIFVVGAPIAWSAYRRQHGQVMRYQKRLEKIYRLAGYEVPDDDEASDG